MIELDGTLGEGGGQVLRTALALSVATGVAFRMLNVRAGRERPGLRAQHLAAVRAAAAVGAAEVEGAEKGSQTLTFAPRGLVAGRHEVDVGTAGSTTLVLQTILPPLLTAPEPAHLVVGGGTHNPLAPPFEFLDRVYLPAIRRMGPRVTARLERHGFQPAGGGRIVVDVEPVPRLTHLDLRERGPVRTRRGTVLLAGLPLHVAEREARVVQRILGWDEDEVRIEVLAGAKGPGNAVLLQVDAVHATELASAFGQRGVPAEVVARSASHALMRWLAADVPVGEHLADQLLLPMALGAGGAFLTVGLSSHAQTQVLLIPRFLDVAIATTPHGADRTEVEVGLSPSP